MVIFHQNQSKVELGVSWENFVSPSQKKKIIIKFLLKVYKYFIFPMIYMVNVISCMLVFVFKETIYNGTLLQLLYIILQYKH